MPETSTTLIMHLDMDAFFAAVEQRDRPELQGRPVVVGAMPGSRGVVATCSYEARVYGIRSAMPIAEAWRRCPDAAYLRPDGRRYAEASRRVMEVLAGISPLVEQVSVDEAYLDISGLERLYGPPREIGRLAKERILHAVDLTCSVGIGPNRLIAKLASEHDKPDGLTVVLGDAVQPFLDELPVAALRGVGRETMKLVRRLGLNTVRELRECSLELLQAQFGERGGRYLHDQARGIASSRVGGGGERKSISKETTFERDLQDRRRLRATLRRLASEVAASARRHGVAGRVVTLKLRLAGFETHTRQLQLSRPVDSDGEIFRSAWSLYEASGFAGQPVRLIGVGISRWDSAGLTGDLFADAGQAARKQSVYRTMDRVREKFGKGKIGLGLESDDEKGRS